MNECPKCGSSHGVYIKERYFGTCDMHYDFNGEAKDTEGLYNGAGHRELKYVYCADCHKRLMTVDEFRQ